MTVYVIFDEGNTFGLGKVVYIEGRELDAQYVFCKVEESTPRHQYNKGGYIFFKLQTDKLVVKKKRKFLSPDELQAHLKHIELIENFKIIIPLLTDGYIYKIYNETKSNTNA